MLKLMLEPSLGSERPKRAKMNPRGPSRASKSQKPSFSKTFKKPMGFLKVLENEGFWFFEAPDGSFWLILALLGRSDPKLGSNMSFNIYLQNV